jgi:large subunit ribosomal protein L10e
MYREIKGKAYTRKEYMGGVPDSRITQFDLGDLRSSFPVAVHLLAGESCQIRHVALEAARIGANRYISKRAGSSGYRLKIRVYPHHVLRENKIAVGAGADRISDGMRAAFGTPVGTAARVREGQRVMTIETRPETVGHAKEALRKAGSKLPFPARIVVEEKD